MDHLEPWKKIYKLLVVNRRIAQHVSTTCENELYSFIETAAHRMHF